MGHPDVWFAPYGSPSTLGAGLPTRLFGRASLAYPGTAAALAVLDREVWLVSGDEEGHVLCRFAEDGSATASPVPLGHLGAEVTIQASRVGVRMALVEGTNAVLIRATSSGVAVEALGPRGRDRRILLAPRGVVERRAGRLVAVSGRDLPPLEIPEDLAGAALRSGGAVLDGAAAIVELEKGERTELLLYELRRGELRRRIFLAGARIACVAERRGQVVLRRGEHIALLDLREGRCVRETQLPAGPHAIAVDAVGHEILIIGDDGDARPLEWAHRAGETAAIVLDEEPSTRIGDEPAAPVAPTAASPVVAPELASPCDVEPARLPWPGRDELRALRPRRDVGALDEDERRHYLAATRRMVLAWCRVAAALGEREGRLRARATSPIDELAGLLDPTAPARPTFDLGAARFAERDAHADFAAWSRRGVPHVELAAELELSPLALTILWAAAAPLLWGEVATAYGLLRGAGRGHLVDEHLLALILEITDRSMLARELDADAPLVREGVIAIGDGERPFAPLRVSRTALRRLAGEASFDAADACTLDEVIAPPGVIHALFADLRGQTAPARIVLRGRRGSGRRTLAAALGIHVGRPVAHLDVRTSEPLHELARRLLEIHVAGGMPCVSIEHDVEGDDAGPAAARLGAILDGHPGPLVVRTGVVATVPLAAGFHTVELSGLTPDGRRAAWQMALERRGLDPAAGAALARRCDVGPGIADRVVERVVAAGEPVDAANLERRLRKQRAARFDGLATRVTTGARWADLVLPPELFESLRELVARVSLRGRVLGEWGLGRFTGHASGVTALFQGAPGTGKTLAANVVATALGHELYRVDLSRMLSKWIGETEKNLGELFDAAEDGECVLLFDEADSLFGKRTEVKSSHDRYANAEVNYLLQRLDAFSGIAILTTNFGASIDPAFKRRLASHLQFPFPDADERERLWRAHVPPTLPVAGEIDFTALANGWQLSGGYIRNAAIRAAFLAAAEERALGMEHLLRAVRLEYRDRARLAEGGRLE